MIHKNLITCCLKRQWVIFVFLFLVSPWLAAQHNKNITGQVLGLDGRGISFATIYIKEFNSRAISNEEGLFSFAISDKISNITLHFTVIAIGYTRFDTVWKCCSEEKLQFALAKQILQLKEVQVISIQEKPLLKDVLQLIPKNHRKEDYYTSIVGSTSSIKNKLIVESYVHAKGISFIPKKTQGSHFNPEFSLESLWIHKSSNPQGVRVGWVNYTTEQAYDFFSLLSDIYKSKNYNLNYTGITEVNNRICYHIEFRPKVNSNESRLYSGYVDIDTTDKAVMQYNQEFILCEDQTEETFNYSLGFWAKIFGVKGFWREEKVFVRFKKHDNLYILDVVNYNQKILQVFKNGGREYFSLQRNLDVLDVIIPEQYGIFNPIQSKLIQKDSISKFQDNVFWDQYFKLSEKF